MNAPFLLRDEAVVLSPDDPDTALRIEQFVAGHPAATPFHRLAWLNAVARGTGNRVLVLGLEQGAVLSAILPLLEVHSALFGRVLVSSGFGVGGGMLVTGHGQAEALLALAEEQALLLSCPTIELRGGSMPVGRDGWQVRVDSHCGFAADLLPDDAAQLQAIPRKQRAELRKGLAADLAISIGSGQADRDAHYAVFAESVRNLGTPVFPRQLFAGVLDRFGEDADILTVWHGGQPVASVLSLYHRGVVMPYWGGGTRSARSLRANDRMYFELMRHARQRGCTRFDFGRSKVGSGAAAFKQNWGFVAEPMAYASWTAPGAPRRDADPTSRRHAARIAVWKKLPLALANRLGPLIARGLA